MRITGNGVENYVGTEFASDCGIREPTGRFFHHEWRPFTGEAQDMAHWFTRCNRHWPERHGETSQNKGKARS
jgi:hypothetical protein